MHFYLCGEAIKVEDKLTRSKILPGSLGFIAYFPSVTQSIGWLYDCIFYRVGKTGKPRIMGAKLRLPIIDPETALAEGIKNDFLTHSHTVTKLPKTNLLECDYIVFMAYLVAMVNAYRVAGNNYGHRPARLDRLIQDVKEGRPLTRHLRGEIHVSAYLDNIVRLINFGETDKDIRELLRSHYEGPDHEAYRANELFELHYAFAEKANIIRSYIQMVRRNIREVINEFGRGGLNSGNNEFFVSVLSVLDEVIGERFPFGEVQYA